MGRDDRHGRGVGMRVVSIQEEFWVMVVDWDSYGSEMAP
jgi:hypothetical protein